MLCWLLSAKISSVGRKREVQFFLQERCCKKANASWKTDGIHSFLEAKLVFSSLFHRRWSRWINLTFGLYFGREPLWSESCTPGPAPELHIHKIPGRRKTQFPPLLFPPPSPRWGNLTFFSLKMRPRFNFFYENFRLKIRFQMWPWKEPGNFMTKKDIWKTLSN